VAPAEVLHPIFAGANSISVFLIDAPPPFRYTAGVLYIGVCRSIPSSGDLDGRLKTLEEVEHLGGVATGVGRTTRRLSAFRAPFA
jgi:hypothetical protein